MIYNRPRRQKKKRLTWYFNETIRLSKAAYHANFTCDGDSLVGIKIPDDASMGYVRSGSLSSFAVYRHRRWNAERYRTITFEEEPVGDLLAFLESNATPL